MLHSAFNKLARHPAMYLFSKNFTPSCLLLMVTLRPTGHLKLCDSYLCITGVNIQNCIYINIQNCIYVNIQNCIYELNVPVGRNNCAYWTTENPAEERAVWSVKVVSRCFLCIAGLTGPSTVCLYWNSVTFNRMVHFLIIIMTWKTFSQIIFLEVGLSVGKRQSIHPDILAKQP